MSLLFVAWLAFAQTEAADAMLAAPSPFLLQIKQRDARTFVAEIRNKSPKPQLFLVEWFHQPLQIYLREQNGTLLKVLDNRLRTVKSGPVTWAMYKVLHPQEFTSLAEGHISGNANESFEVTLEPFRFQYVKPGVYWLSFVWRSGEQKCFACSEEQEVRIQRAWKGALRSNEVKLELR